ncbi:uncharacterized protein LOC116348894 [Contarinia nasturtii]|uniref:uncharacterized protein LOC116348894 n=1 Tax=Contarinia nasturtii TaxID=265458 RepID=UPI0012D41B5F|nr:uncharacterized protein LOC116348894 [Contarinia nasturtii]
MKKLLTLCFLNLVSLALCTNNVADDTRKTSIRSASTAVGTSAHLNSLQSSQDSGGKQQSQQQVQSGNGQTSYTRVQTPEFTSITQPHNVYTQPTSPTGGYFISVNPQNVPSGGIGAGPTPVLMQYLPHNAQQGPIQYLQLIPTRPLIVPISPYISGFNNPYSPSVTGPAAQANSNSPYALPHHSYSQPSNAYSSGLGNGYSSTLSNPLGSYSSNYLTYFRPNHGMQMVNGPVDLSLNTNEYLPLSNDNTYKMRRV